MSCENEKEALRWFVLRDLKRANAKRPAYLTLAEGGYDVFTPMRTVIRMQKGRRMRLRIPFIQDLLFVHETRKRLDAAVEKDNTLQYRYEKGAAYREPMVVREEEMERFIYVAQTAENPKYYLPEEITPGMCGRKARIVGGNLDGYEGKILSVRGSRKRQLLVELSGLFSVGVEVEAEFIQFL